MSQIGDMQLPVELRTTNWRQKLSEEVALCTDNSTPLCQAPAAPANAADTLHPESVRGGLAGMHFKSS